MRDALVAQDGLYTLISRHNDGTWTPRVIGSIVGIILGVVLGSLPRVAQAIDPFFMGLYSLPRIALAPLFIIWFGFGFLSKIVMVFSLVVVVFILNTMNGLREVDRDLISLMRTMCATPLLSPQPSEWSTTKWRPTDAFASMRMCSA